MNSALMPPAGYNDFLHEVKTHIRQRQYQALRAANKELLALYWWLGEAISRRQAEQRWGKAVVETLARDLQAEFPGRNGFSAQNLWLMQQFFNEYCDKPKLQPLVGEISWSHNLLIMARCKDDLERELEQALVRNLRAFLAEMGDAFTFVGNQYRLQADGKDYFIDLLLFHRRLRCLVAIELKIGEFKPEHKGQIEFYLEQLDQHHRLEGENPPIGIVICRSKSRTVVEYAPRDMNRPLGIATYTVTPQLPANFAGDLPSPEDIAARLQAWSGLEGTEDE